MKLYDVPRDTDFKLAGDESGTIYHLVRVDNAFSVCHTETEAYVNISANADVEVIYEH